MAKRFITDGAGQELSAQLDNIAAQLNGGETSEVTSGAYASKDFMSEETGRAIATKLGGIVEALSDYAVNKEKIADFSITLLQNIYPVGSIYMSVVSSSPASFLGGTWEQIEDRFLLAAGSTYTAGTTGGEATHALTVNELPSHNHGFDNYYRVLGGNADLNSGMLMSGSDVYFVNASNVASKYTGDGYAHNNMPPYLAVYTWQRIA